MAASTAAFEQSATEARGFTFKPTNEELLELYGLYKQAKEGDNNTAQPWQIQMEAYAKWTAWNSRKGLSKDEAEKKYVETVEGLKTKYQS